MSGFRLFSGRTDERGDFHSPPLLGWHQHCNFQDVWTQELLLLGTVALQSVVYDGLLAFRGMKKF
jgi:hypothetical protein